MSDVDDIMKWEDGQMNDQEEIEFFQGLIDSGMAWQLQGMYGRRAAQLIAGGKCLFVRGVHFGRKEAVGMDDAEAILGQAIRPDPEDENPENEKGGK